MRLGSSTSRSSARWASGLLVLAVGCGAASAPCLPPAIDGGERLQEVGAMRLAHLELALRQHRVCRSPRAGDGPRAFLIGNSAVLGHPLPYPQTFAARLAQRFAAGPARIFNLGTLFTYQLKDVIVLDAALRYRPDVVVWGATLKDFLPKAPVTEPEGIVEFFAVNSARVLALAEAPPIGLAEPLAAYAARFAAAPPAPPAWLLLRGSGAYLQLAVRHAARELLARGLLDPRDLPPPAIDPTLLPSPTRGEPYRCTEVRASFAEHYAGWARWSPFAWLEQVSRERGIEVLVVNLPVIHQPIGACHNALYPAQSFEQYLEWIERESGARGFAYLDLHDLVPASDFLDSLHYSAAGHARMAEALAPAIAALVGAHPTRP